MFSQSTAGHNLEELQALGLRSMAERARAVPRALGIKITSKLSYWLTSPYQQSTLLDGG